MITIIAAAVLSMAWGLSRVLIKSASQSQQSMGLAAILIGVAVSVAANFSHSDAGVMTAVSLLAGASMLVLGIFCLRAIRRPEGGATTLDLSAIVLSIFLFLVGSVFH